MMQHNVLICDDNLAVHTSLTSYLNAEHIHVISTYTGQGALDILKSQPVDVVILDIMLPDIDGMDVCREIRKASDVYILMLSARSEEIDKVIGLELGADDYVTKPYSPREITLRIKRVLKRKYDSVEVKTLSLNDLTVLPEQYKVFIGSEEVKLSAKEVDVLALLLDNKTKVVTREQILNVAWGCDYYDDTRVVDTLIKRLRQKIDRQDAHFQISTVYGVGYKIEAR